MKLKNLLRRKEAQEFPVDGETLEEATNIIRKGWTSLGLQNLDGCIKKMRLLMRKYPETYNTIGGSGALAPYILAGMSVALETLINGDPMGMEGAISEGATVCSKAYDRENSEDRASQGLFYEALITRCGALNKSKFFDEYYKEVFNQRK